MPSVTGFEIVEAEWPMPSGAASGADAGTEVGWPSGMTVRLTIDNPGAAVVLRGGRLRVTCGGGRAAVLVLQERVRIPERGQWRVLVPLRLRIARNASALSLRSAIERRDAGAVSLDWEIEVRRGMWRGRVGDGPATLEGLLPESGMQRMWQVLDRVSGGGAATGEENSKNE